MDGVASPAPKKRKSEGREGHEGREELLNGQQRVRRGEEAEGPEDGEDDKAIKEPTRKENGNDGDDDGMNDADEDETTGAAIRQAAPTAGYDDLYLDTIDRHVLDFDFEKLCSVSLSNINVYACLVCGRYYQGRGPKSHAYFHALDEDHHVFINMQTQRVYVLPEGYEVRSHSLDDIKFVADPRYTRADVARLDRSIGGNSSSVCYTLTGKPYTPGFVGMNNIKDNDYLNVVVQALAHVPPLRNFLLLDEFAGGSSGSHTNGKPPGAGTGTAGLANPNAELVKRFGLLVRKIWNPRAFKAHVSPHELLQEVALRSNRRFTLTAQSDPVDFLTWFLNHLHLGLGGSRTRPGSSIIQRVFQGRVRVESETLQAVGSAAAAAAAAAATGDNAEPQHQQHASFDAMQIDMPPLRPLGPMQPLGPLPMHTSSHPLPPPQPLPPGVGAPGFGGFQQPPPPGIAGSGFPHSSLPPPPPPPPPGMSTLGSSSLPPPPPPSFFAASATSASDAQDGAFASPDAAATPAEGAPAQTAAAAHKPSVDVSRFLLLTLDLPPAPLFQDEQERNSIPQVALTALLQKYDGETARDHGDVRRRFRLHEPLPPYLVLHMKRFSANKFVTERNPTIVTFDPRGLDMRPFVEGADSKSSEANGEPLLYDLVANVVHEAVRTGGGDDVAVDSAEERRTWKVQLRDRSGATSGTAVDASGGTLSIADGEDRWVVAQDLFVEPVAGELLYLAESYIQIWERRQPPRTGANGTKGKAALRR